MITDGAVSDQRCPGPHGPGRAHAGTVAYSAPPARGPRWAGLVRLGRVLRQIRHAAPWQHQKFKYRRYQVARAPQFVRSGC